MLEQSDKLVHFTNTVLQEATANAQSALEQLEQQKAADLAKAQQEISLTATAHKKAEMKRMRVESGRQVSQHLMDCKRSIFLRRSEIADEVFDQVKQRVEAFIAQGDYIDHLKQQLTDAVTQLGAVSHVVICLRQEDVHFFDQLAQAIHPVSATLQVGEFSLGGVSVECPELGRSIDGSYDSAIGGLSGHFAENFGLSLADDF